MTGPDHEDQPNAARSSAAVSPTAADEGPDSAAAGARQWTGFGFLALALLVIALDLSVTDVAVPSIVSDLGVSADDASLVVTVYMVVASSFMVLMGKVSDLVGARKAFLVGAATFAVGSFITGIAPNFGILILGRVIQGLVLAITIPASMSILNHEFPSGPSRATAFSVWTAVIGSAMALGPLVGGFLSTYASWRWAFFINVPIMVVAVVGSSMTIRPIAVKLVEKGFDLLGAGLLVIGVASITFALQEATSLGWWSPDRDTILGGAATWDLPVSPVPILLAVGIVLVAGFVYLERVRVRRGLGVVLELKLFRVPTFTWGTAAAALMTAGVFGLLLMIPLYAQYVLDKDPLGAGIALAPLGVGMALGGPIISRINVSQRVAVIWTLAVQPIATLSLVPLISADAATWWLAPALVVNGFAWGAAYSILVSMLLADVPETLSGVAGGTQTSARLLAGAIGGALLTTVLLGSVNLAESGVDESELTSSERTELEQLYEFSAQVHPPTTDSGDTVAEKKSDEAFASAIEQTKDDMARGIRFAVVGAAVFAAGGYLCGRRLRHALDEEAAAAETPAGAGKPA
ncbi:MAG: MFS transporter [Actinomycetia bacterium]|nr:MFS transporter [Actinomycetes bacterium]